VDDLLNREDVEAAIGIHGRPLVLDALRDAVAQVRDGILAGEGSRSADEIVADAFGIVEERTARSLRRVINATGIVVHTNLGRSILSADAVDAVGEAAGSYSNLEYDIESGERGSRHAHVEELLVRLTGAEAAMAVNNNAGAVLIALAALAAGREAIVSRGELVEIGGSFRIPDIMAVSGARMVEVGTTNKTHVHDYEQAIGADTGLLLKVHSSNYRMVGFTQEVGLDELVPIGRKHGVPVYEDQGSGVLVDLREFGLPYEPTMRAALEAGADLVSGSGDKLLGGPQAGILAGSAEVIGALKSHPLARVLRLDKMTLAALEATLRLYLDPASAVERVPTLRMLAASADEMKARSGALAGAIADACGDAYETEVVPDTSRAGGGALPMADIPTFVVALAPISGDVVGLEERLRLGTPSIVARIKDDRLRFDPRTLSEAEQAEIADALARAAG
jgi:L-seryl-tRNA(Ser) seleniumtransferase